MIKPRNICNYYLKCSFFGIWGWRWICTWMKFFFPVPFFPPTPSPSTPNDMYFLFLNHWVLHLILFLRLHTALHKELLTNCLLRWIKFVWHLDFLRALRKYFKSFIRPCVTKPYPDFKGKRFASCLQNYFAICVWCHPQGKAV